jgi:hypothetical protein
MSTIIPQSEADLTDEERARSIQEGEAWALDYLDRVPFEDLHVALAEHALSQLLLALGPRYGRGAVARVLGVLVASSPKGAECDEIRRRIEAADITLLRDHEAEVDIDWQDIAGEFAHLFAFARYGYGRHVGPEASHAEIEALIAHFRGVVADEGIRTAAGKHFGWLSDTLAAAEARWALDHGRPVMPDDLAALAGVKSKTIANLLAARELPTDADGRIPTAEALRYLERREGFVRSNWQHPVERSGTPDGTEPGALAEQVFVPVDSDGNPFLPSIARRGRDGLPRYAIGAKSDPEYVEDYWEALDRLSRMPTPRWRRPPISGKGGWSLVSGQEGWRRFARIDLERMVEALRTEGRER